jgi:hypothetical protein
MAGVLADIWTPVPPEYKSALSRGQPVRRFQTLKIKYTNILKLLCRSTSLSGGYVPSKMFCWMIWRWHSSHHLKNNEGRVNSHPKWSSPREDATAAWVLPILSSDRTSVCNRTRYWITPYDTSIECKIYCKLCLHDNTVVWAYRVAYATRNWLLN